MDIREVFPESKEIDEIFKRIGVDPDGARVMAPKTRFRFFYIRGLRAPAANILKQEALSYGAELAVSIGVINCSVKLTDALLWGDERRLSLLAEKIRGQVYGLGDLAEALISALSQQKPVWVANGKEIGFGKPLIMGILNITPDSFYEGGRCENPVEAIERGLRMAEEGADILDIGGESTRPGSEPVRAVEELRRVIPAIEGLRKALGKDFIISVDTYKAAVAREAISAGADIINDISGLGFDEEMAKVIAETHVGLIIMHIKGTPKDMQVNPHYDDTIGEIRDYLRRRLDLAIQHGITPERIAIDPGIGFGKRVCDNLLILKKIPEFKTLGRPIVIGHSRKSFIGKVLGIESADERLFGSLGVAAISAWLGADVIRTHDVKETAQAVRMAKAIASPEDYLT
ncbi:MAG: dihydropteroate synthase [candidate division WOR-3 bacterium]